jgi:hypothetical protein
MQHNEIKNIIERLSCKFKGEQLEMITEVIYDEFFCNKHLAGSYSNIEQLQQAFFHCFLVNVKKVSLRKTAIQTAVFKLFCYVSKKCFHYKYTLKQIADYLEYDGHKSIVFAINGFNELRSINDPLTMEVYNQWLKFININQKQIAA